MGESLHDGHRDRLRERFLKEGLDSFEEHEVLELLLYYCIKRKNTNEIAHRILKVYGSISNLFEADANDIQKTCNLSYNTSVFITMFPHISRKYSASKWAERPLLGNVKEASKYCISLFTGRIYETFFVICLDNNNKLISTSKLNEGSVNETHIDTKVIVETALRFQASSMILAHNHPGGNLAPSFEDITATANIVYALEPIAIKLIDHIIVSGEKYYSFREKKLLFKGKNIDDIEDTDMLTFMDEENNMDDTFNNHMNNDF